jgi:ankyrin repeat protein
MDYNIKAMVSEFRSLISNCDNNCNPKNFDWNFFKVRQLLLSYKQDNMHKTILNFQDCNGINILHFICYYNIDQRILKLILPLGLEINAQTHTGQTPLHYAIHFNGMEYVPILEKNGADWTIKNNEGKTPKDEMINKKIDN